jgi:ligand-binding sensor domain-containing protein/signal transduction histidine kinase
VRLERLGSEDGLSHNSVYAILQDSQGFLWFGTQGGLDRYDAHSFLSFRHDPANPRSLASNWIGALVEDRAGTFWVGTHGGLHRRRRDGDGFDRITLAAPGDRATMTRSVTSLAEGADGQLWVGTDRGLFRIDPPGDSVTAFLHDPADASSLASDTVRAIRIAPDGAPWILTEGPGEQSALLRFSGGFERFDVPQTWALSFTATGDLWLDPTKPVTAGELRARQVNLSRASRITALTEASNGRLWVGTYNGLFYREPDTSELRLASTSDLGAGALAGEVNTIAEDRAGNIWVGTFGGVVRYDPHAKAFDHLSAQPGQPEGLSSNAVSGVLEDGEGRIWIGTYGDGLNAVEPVTNRVTQYRHRQADTSGLCGDYIWDITPSRRGTLWATTTAGFCRLEQGHFRTYHLPRKDLSPLTLREDAKGRLWMGTVAGLYLFEPETESMTLIGGRAEGVPQPVDALHLHADGRVWAASGSSPDLAAYDPDRRQISTFTHVAQESVWDIESAGDGALWLATGAGLVRFDPAASKPDAPLAANEAGSVYYSVVADADGRLWAGTNKGMMSYDPRAGVFRQFGLGDGIGNLEFNRHAAFAGRSRLFLGGMNGVTSFIPSTIQDNAYLPPVVLTAVQTLGSGGERTVRSWESHELILPPDAYTVSFEFAALNFTQSQKNQFAYKLEGFDREWIQSGTRRTARYTNLPPGRYVLRVGATNNDGLRSPYEVALPVTVFPAFWQTWWFRSLAAGTVAAALFGLHRLRIRRLVEMERMRLWIASDLHDELGSELSGIALATRLIGSHDQLTDRDRQRLADVATSAARATAGLRDIVWHISPEQDTLLSLEQRMRAAARTMLETVHHEFHSSGIRPAPLDLQCRRHVFLIYKELLTNIVRHARATKVEIGLHVTGRVLRLEISDNGVGLPGGVTDGTGLRNVRRRAAELDANLEIDGQPGAGTRVRLTTTMSPMRPGGRAAGA